MQVGEEIVWYPELERVLGAEGKKAADHDRAEHQTVSHFAFHTCYATH